MFNEKTKIQEKIETLIGEHCIIHGNLEGEGVIQIDGTIDGDIHWQSDLLFGEKSHCCGNISCINAIVSGNIEGNVNCDNTLTIEGNGNVKGDITVKNLVIKEGGTLDGKCTMLSSKNT